MLKPSSDSVVIKLPDRETLIQRLKIISDQMMEDFPEIEEIILFGSLARGDYGVYSDADVFIILSSSPYERFFDRIPKYVFSFIDYDMSVEVFPYTRKEIERMSNDGNLFITSAIGEGISLSSRFS